MCKQNLLPISLPLEGEQQNRTNPSSNNPVFRPRFELDTYRQLFRSYTNFRQFVGNHVTVCILLGISPASDCGLPTFRNPLSVPSSRDEDGTDRGFRNVGIQQSDAGEIPKRIHTIFKTRRKFEIKNHFTVWEITLLAISCTNSRPDMK